jgi:hypothetical protein
MEAQLQVLAGGYGMSKGMVQIDPLLGTILYLARTEGKQNAYMESGKRKWLLKE